MKAIENEEYISKAVALTHIVLSKPFISKHWQYGFNRFRDVEQHYANTKPYVSRTGWCSLEDDIRPVGSTYNRWLKRKHTHINVAKVHNDEYVINGGDNSGISTLIKWERRYLDRKHHEEYITVYNRDTDSRDQSQVYLNVLHHVLPWGLLVRTKGKYDFIGHVRTYPTGKNELLDWDYRYLPRTGADGALTYRVVKELDDLDTMNMGHRWACKTFELVSGGDQQAPHYGVDKWRKEYLREHMEKFYQWGCSLGNVLPVDNPEYNERVRKELTNNGIIHTQPWHNRIKYEHDKVTMVIMDDSHEMRLPLLSLFAARSGMRDVSSGEDLKKLRAKYNSWINTACGLRTEQEKK